MVQQTKKQQNNISFTYRHYFKKESVGDFLLKKGYSSGNVFDLIKNQHVSVDGIVIKDKNYLLTFHNKTVLVVLNDEFSSLPSVNKDIEVVYEDDYFLIVNKPGHLDVEPTKRNYENNLACYVNYYFKEHGIKSNIHFVNRLDKLTSGLVIIAKNQYIHNLFKKVKITKKYEALAKGNIPDKGVIRIKIAKEENSMKRIISGTGKLSVTKYKKTKMVKEDSLAEVTLLTGRTHQIRLSFASIGHPLLNDPLYGTDEGGKMYLKAYYLKFTHPVTKKLVSIKI